jgi:hypothetical protein
MIFNTETNLNQGNPSQEVLYARNQCQLKLGAILSLLREHFDKVELLGKFIDDLTKQILKTDQQGEILKGYFDAMKQSGQMLKKKALAIFFE